MTEADNHWTIASTFIPHRLVRGADIQRISRHACRGVDETSVAKRWPGLETASRERLRSLARKRRPGEKMVSDSYLEAAHVRRRSIPRKSAKYRLLAECGLPFRARGARGYSEHGVNELQTAAVHDRCKASSACT